MKNNKKRGFTIVELVIVIAVIAILAAVLIPTFSNVIAKANESKAMQEARNAWIEYIAGLSDTELAKFATYNGTFEYADGHWEIKDGQFTGTKLNDAASTTYVAATTATTATTATPAG